MQIQWVAESGKFGSSIYRKISPGIRRRLLWSRVWANLPLEATRMEERITELRLEDEREAREG